jgi:hypothetical protein
MKPRRNRYRALFAGAMLIVMVLLALAQRGLSTPAPSFAQDALSGAGASPIRYASRS